MLIVKVYVNLEQIDEICVQNIGFRKGDTEEVLYRVVKPVGHENQLIAHDPHWSYHKLLARVLEKLDPYTKRKEDSWKSKTKKSLER